MLAYVKFWMVLMLWFAGFAGAQAFPPLPPVTLERVVEGLQDPLYVTAPSQDKRLFVVNRSGTVIIVKNGQVLQEPFIDVSQQTATVGEMGLLSLAFHPRYSENGRVFILFTRLNPFDTVIAEFRRDPDNSDLTRPYMQVVLSIPQDPVSTIHRGGHLEFGPDGKLYASTGDSGLNLGQDESWNGKVLRLDVDKSRVVSPHAYTVPVELYAKGLRNAWRFSFDTQRGDMYLGDVGSSLYEEVNLIREGDNYGWPYMEGTICLDVQFSSFCNSDVFTKPLYSYAHLDRDAYGGSAVIGGYVYRGSIKALQGAYIFADMIGRLWALKKQGNTYQRISLAQPWGGIVSLGRDAAGELYIVNITNGSLYRLVLKPTDLKLANLLREKPETVALDGFSELFQGTRWMYGPESSMRFYFSEAAALTLHFAGQHHFAGQTLRVIQNGRVVLYKILPKTFELKLSLAMVAGVNELRFEVSQWDKNLAAPYALQITDFSLKAFENSAKD